MTPANPNYYRDLKEGDPVKWVSDVGTVLTGTFVRRCMVFKDSRTHDSGIIVETKVGNSTITIVMAWDLFVPITPLEALALEAE